MTDKNGSYEINTLFINISQIPAGGVLSFSASGHIDVPDVLCPGASKAPAELMFAGCLERKDGYRFYLEGAMSASLNVFCSLCLKDTSYTVKTDIREVFNRETNSDTEEWPFSGNIIDLTQALRSNLLTVLPVRILCQDDCRGLCPVCGADLNVTQCGCGAELKKPNNNMFNDLQALQKDIKMLNNRKE